MFSADLKTRTASTEFPYFLICYVKMYEKNLGIKKFGGLWVGSRATTIYPVKSHKNDTREPKSAGIKNKNMPVVSKNRP